MRAQKVHSCKVQATDYHTMPPQ